jgi:hypothetical protein
MYIPRLKPNIKEILKKKYKKKYYFFINNYSKVIIMVYFLSTNSFHRGGLNHKYHYLKGLNLNFKLKHFPQHKSLTKN